MKLTDKIEVLNMDCMDYIKDIDDNYFDLAIVDPPYGWGEKLKGRNKSGNAENWNVSPSKEYFNELLRVSKNSIIWGGNYFDLPKTRCFIVWDKKQPVKQFARIELAWTDFEKNSELFEYRYYGNINRENGRFHPCQKPIKLYEWLLDNYAKPDYKIIDTHLGSGSSAIAAHYYGCEFAGIELDSDYYNSMIKRFEENTKQMKLF